MDMIIWHLGLINEAFRRCSPFCDDFRVLGTKKQHFISGLLIAEETLKFVHVASVRKLLTSGLAG